MFPSRTLCSAALALLRALRSLDLELLRLQVKSGGLLGPLTLPGADDMVARAGWCDVHGRSSMSAKRGKMTSSRFIDVLNNEVATFAETYSLSKSKAFLAWFGRLAFDLSDDDAFDGVIVDSPNDKGIDLFWVDDYHERVIVAQGKYSQSGKSRPKVREVESLFSSLDWLASPETLQREGKTELAEAANEYLEATRQDYTVELWFVYCGPRNEAIDQRVRVFNANPDNQQKRRTCRHCDIGLLENLFEEYRGKGRRIEVATVRIDPKVVEVSGGFGRGLVATIPGKGLVSLYSQFGDSLFARNVRLFLGAKRGSVNAGIIETIEDSAERSNFWAYNNGVTMVCDKYELDESAGTLTLHNFSVVNGCQTTVALNKAEHSVTDEVNVLLRVISPPERAIDSIIRFTNSQNQIRVWDIRSQDRTQKKLQRDFENLRRPYYYQLRRGDVQSLDPTYRKKFRNGRKMRTIRHDLLTQYIAAFRQKPVMAYKHKSLLFTKLYDEVFPLDMRVEEALLVWKVSEVTQQKIREEIRNDATRGNNQDVLILKRGGLLYALGIFGLIAKLRNGPDYLRTIDETRITSKRATDRIGKYAVISTLWYKDAVKDLLKLSGKDLSVLVRESNFFEQVAERIESRYRTMALDRQWLIGGLPHLF
jgi:hypothetical protein